jgi:hypothetical protein
VTAQSEGRGIEQPSGSVHAFDPHAQAPDIAESFRGDGRFGGDGHKIARLESEIGQDLDHGDVAHDEAFAGLGKPLRARDHGHAVLPGKIGGILVSVFVLPHVVDFQHISDMRDEGLGLLGVDQQLRQAAVGHLLEGYEPLLGDLIHELERRHGLVVVFGRLPAGVPEGALSSGLVGKGLDAEDDGVAVGELDLHLANGAHESAHDASLPSLPSGGDALDGGWRQPPLLWALVYSLHPPRLDVPKRAT